MKLPNAGKPQRSSAWARFRSTITTRISAGATAARLPPVTAGVAFGDPVRERAGGAVIGAAAGVSRAAVSGAGGAGVLLQPAVVNNAAAANRIKRRGIKM